MKGVASQAQMKSMIVVKSDVAQRQASQSHENTMTGQGHSKSNNYLSVIQNDKKEANQKALRMMNSLSPTPNVSANPPLL